MKRILNNGLTPQWPDVVDSPCRLRHRRLSRKTLLSARPGLPARMSLCLPCRHQERLSDNEPDTIRPDFFRTVLFSFANLVQGISITATTIRKFPGHFDAAIEPLEFTRQQPSRTPLAGTPSPNLRISRGEAMLSVHAGFPLFQKPPASGPRLFFNFRVPLDSALPFASKTLVQVQGSSEHSLE